VHSAPPPLHVKQKQDVQYDKVSDYHRPLYQLVCFIVASHRLYFLNFTFTKAILTLLQHVISSRVFNMKRVSPFGTHLVSKYQHGLFILIRLLVSLVLKKPHDFHVQHQQ
jgi:hypothetical protein